MILLSFKARASSLRTYPETCISSFPAVANLPLIWLTCGEKVTLPNYARTIYALRSKRWGEYFQQIKGVNLPQETIRALEQRTDGWVTALQMAALSLRYQPDPKPLLANLKGDVHYLVDFLTEEVLDQQPDDIRSSC